MPSGKCAPRAAQQGNEVVARGVSAHLRTGVPGSAGLVDLACGDAKQPDTRTFRIPDWTVTAPDRHWRAGEVRARREDGGSGEDK